MLITLTTITKSSVEQSVEPIDGETYYWGQIFDEALNESDICAYFAAFLAEDRKEIADLTMIDIWLSGSVFGEYREYGPTWRFSLKELCLGLADDFITNDESIEDENDKEYRDKMKLLANELRNLADTVEAQGLKGL